VKRAKVYGEAAQKLREGSGRAGEGGQTCLQV
jgi:hypothetical protein